MNISGVIVDGHKKIKFFCVNCFFDSLKYNFF